MYVTVKNEKGFAADELKISKNSQRSHSIVHLSPISPPQKSPRTDSLKDLRLHLPSLPCSSLVTFAFFPAPGLALQSSGAILLDVSILWRPGVCLQASGYSAPLPCLYFPPTHLRAPSLFFKYFLRHEPQCPCSLSPLSYPHGPVAGWILCFSEPTARLLSGAERKTVIQPQTLAPVT